MTFYADLDVSVIAGLPPGRKPVVTRLIDQERRDEVIARIHAATLDGRQVYWVCPLIEESESLQLQTAVDTHAVLADALERIIRRAGAWADETGGKTACHVGFCGWPNSGARCHNRY